MLLFVVLAALVSFVPISNLVRVAGPADIVQKMTMLQQYSFVCAPSFAQYGALKALELGR